VAGFTGLREVRRDVVRVRGSLIILQVAGYACPAGQVVVVADVAIGACSRRNRVRARQGKAGSRVIELSVSP